MGKAAKKTTIAEGDIQQAIVTFNAKQQFFSSVLSMSWQLALTVVIPVVAGVKLDQKFDTAPSLTLTGFFLAVFAASMIVWNTVKDVNKLQAEEDMNLPKTPSSGSKSPASSQNPPRARQRNSGYASSPETDSDSESDNFDLEERSLVNSKDLRGKKRV